MVRYYGAILGADTAENFTFRHTEQYQTGEVLKTVLHRFAVGPVGSIQIWILNQK
jgi:hypothetical protein